MSSEHRAYDTRKPTLYEHGKRPHESHNASTIHRTEQAVAGINTKIALLLTRGVGTMACAYIFLLLALLGFPGFHATLTAYVQWVSQTLIQLVMLSVLAVGQTILGHQADLQAEEQFKLAQNTYHDAEQIAAHLTAQDAQILAMDQKIVEILSVLESKPPRRTRGKEGGTA